MSDPIADMLTRIRNGSRARLPEVAMPSSIEKTRVADVLKAAGYILDWRVEGDVHKALTVELKYQGKAREPVIEGLRRVSKPSCRVYAPAKKLPRVLGGLGVAVISTSQGLMTDRAAREKNIGGEVLCYVW